MPNCAHDRAASVPALTRDSRAFARHCAKGVCLMSVDLTMPVLVVHDHPTMGAIVTNVLRQIGFAHIDGATNGRKALQKLDDKNYGLVISDEAMTPMSGE